MEMKSKQELTDYRLLCVCSAFIQTNQGKYKCKVAIETQAKVEKGKSSSCEGHLSSTTFLKAGEIQLNLKSVCVLKENTEPRKRRDPND